MTVKCIDKEFEVTVGKEYKVLSLTNQGDFYRFRNDSGIVQSYREESFVRVPKSDDIKAKCLADVNIDLCAGNVYDVLSVDTVRKECRVIDGSGEDYIYPCGCFALVRGEEGCDG